MTSISFRLQRITVESTHVSVPVTDAMLLPPEPDGTLRLDVDKLVAQAVRLGGADTAWRVDETSVTPHPLQTPPPSPE